MQTFIYDHVRTPRGKGKPDGSLHELTPVWLASRPLVALARRNGLDAGAVDDVVMGCVMPVGEQGGQHRAHGGAAGRLVKNNVGERVLGLPGEPRSDEGVAFNKLVR